MTAGDGGIFRERRAERRPSDLAENDTTTTGKVDVSRLARLHSTEKLYEKNALGTPATNDGTKVRPPTPIKVRLPTLIVSDVELMLKDH